MELTRTPGGGICSHCGQVRPLGSLLAFWPNDRPSFVRFVCRPSDPVPPFMSCFRETVGPVTEHTIIAADHLDRGVAA